MRPFLLSLGIAIFAGLVNATDPPKFTTPEPDFPADDLRAPGPADKKYPLPQDDAKATAGFARQYGVTFPMALDEKEKGYPASNAYGLTNVPTVFLIDADGTVRVSSMGFVKADLERIAAELAERRKITPAALFNANESVPANRPG